MKEFDAVIVGGGPAGAATALALARRGYSAAIIERSDYRHTRIGETLPPAVQPLLVQLGVWDQFLAEKHSPSFGIHSAWGRDDLYDNDFIFNPYGSGWHVDRVRLDAAFARWAEDAGVRVYRRSHLLSCARNNASGWQMEVASCDRRRGIRSKFLVDATGRASWIAGKQGASRMTYDRLVGVTFFCSPSLPMAVTDSYTLIEATEQGWWYSAPLPDSRLVIAYMTDADLYARARKRASDYWQRQLQGTAYTSLRAKNYEPSYGPCIMPANSSRVDRIAGNLWLAVGDAAMAFDPLSGQGIYRALQSSIRAAQAIEEDFTGRDESCERYELELGQSFNNYLIKRTDYYVREKRWLNAVFWQRRQKPTPNFRHLD